MDTLFAIPKMAPKDVFNSFLVTNATYDGEEEIPVIKTSNSIPEKVISFSNAKSKQDYDAWVHFYQDDSKIECFWRNPQKYLPMLKRYKGVISPDYSLYYDFVIIPSSSQVTAENASELHGFRYFYSNCNGFCIVNPVNDKMFIFSGGVGYGIIGSIEKVLDQLKDW